MYEDKETLSQESQFLLDGLVSYLGAVIQERAPEARWEIARHRIKRYLFNNHPVLVSGKGKDHNFLPGVPSGDAHASTSNTVRSSARAKLHAAIHRPATWMLADLPLPCSFIWDRPSLAGEPL